MNYYFIKEMSCLEMLKVSPVCFFTSFSRNCIVQEEARRVEEAGGMVVLIQGELRVNGVLNLTRSLGLFCMIRKFR